MTDLQSAGFPHSEIYGSKVACHLPEAYRRLLRPSSSFDVKASTIRSYCVLTITLENTIFIGDSLVRCSSPDPPTFSLYQSEIKSLNWLKLLFLFYLLIYLRIQLSTFTLLTLFGPKNRLSGGSTFLGQNPGKITDRVYVVFWLINIVNLRQ